MSNEIQKMFCPSCGAPIQFQPGREDTFCSSCGTQLFFKDDHLEMKLKHEENKMLHEEHMAQEERWKKDAEWGGKFTLLLWGFIGLFIIVVFLAMIFT